MEGPRGANGWRPPMEMAEAMPVDMLQKEYVKKYSIKRGFD